MFSLVLDRRGDFGVRGDHVGVVDVLAFQVGDDLLRIIQMIAVLANQPSRRLGKPWNSGVEDDNEDKLKGERESPGGRSRDERKRKSHPVGERIARYVHDHLDNHQLASPLDLRCLALPDRRRGRVHSVPKTGHDPANYHLGDAVTGNLQDCANGHDRSPCQDGLLPAQFLAKVHSCNSPEETSDVVDCRNGSDQLLVVPEVMRVQEILGDNDTGYEQAS